LQKYLRALVLTVMADVPALVSFLLLVAGGAELWSKPVDEPLA
jgi:hypothetical protein